MFVNKNKLSQKNFCFIKNSFTFVIKKKKNIIIMIGILPRRFYHVSRSFFSTSTVHSSLAKLRKSTGYSVSNCKKALEMYPDDLKKAEEWLHSEAKKLGWSKWNKMQNRVAAQGLIGVYAKNDFGIMVEVNCETDFVARNIEFQKLIGNVLLGCIERNCELVKQNQEDFQKHYLSEGELMNLECRSFSMQALLNAAVSKFNEKTVLKRAVILKALGSNIGIAGLSHPAEVCQNFPEATLGKFGALVVYQQNEKPQEEIKALSVNVCQHVIGMNPSSIGSEDFLSLYNSGKIKIGDADSQNQTTEKIKIGDADSSQNQTIEKEVSSESIESEDDSEADLSKSDLKDSDESRLLFQSYLLDPSLHVYDVLWKNVRILDFERFECGGETKESEKAAGVGM